MQKVEKKNVKVTLGMGCSSLIYWAKEVMPLEKGGVTSCAWRMEVCSNYGSVGERKPELWILWMMVQVCPRAETQVPSENLWLRMCVFDLLHASEAECRDKISDLSILYVLVWDYEIVVLP